MVTISAHSASAISHVCVLYFLTILPLNTRISQPLKPLSDHQPQRCSSFSYLTLKAQQSSQPNPKNHSLGCRKNYETCTPIRVFTHHLPTHHSHPTTIIPLSHPPPTFPLTTRTPQPSSHIHHPTTIPQPQISPPAPKPALTTHTPPSTSHHLSPPSPPPPHLPSPHLASSHLPAPPFPSFHPQQTSRAPRHDPHPRKSKRARFES